MDLNWFLLGIGLVLFLDSLVVLIFKDWCKKVLLKLAKSSSLLRKIGLIELAIALLLVLIGSELFR